MPGLKLTAIAVAGDGAYCSAGAGELLRLHRSW